MDVSEIEPFRVDDNEAQDEDDSDCIEGNGRKPGDQQKTCTESENF